MTYGWSQAAVIPKEQPGVNTHPPKKTKKTKSRGLVPDERQQTPPPSPCSAKTVEDFFLGGWVGVTRLNLPLRGDIALLHMGLNSSHERHGSFLVSSFAEYEGMEIRERRDEQIKLAGRDDCDHRPIKCNKNM